MFAAWREVLGIARADVALAAPVADLPAPLIA
jgi:hypothetical protein